MGLTKRYDKQEIAPQIEFKSLDNFVKNQNNFYIYFTDDCEAGKIYRKFPHFKRFQEAHSELEKKVTTATVDALRSKDKSKQKLPYEELWEAYKCMTKYVFIDDKYVVQDGRLNNRVLIS